MASAITEMDGFFTKSSPGDPSSDVLIIAGKACRSEVQNVALN